MSDPGPSSRLPPPIPYPGASTNGSPSPSDFAPPPPPKTFRVSNSPIMQPTLTPISPPLTTSSPNGSSNGPSSPSSPTSTSMTPSRSWTRIQPQQPFVNGRGNVQLPGAAKQFIPSPNGSSTGSPVINGSPALGVQREGHQAYVRREPSPGPSRLPGESPPLAGAATVAAADGSALGYLPNQFGVRQRVAIKTSSRPTAPRSSLPGGSSAGGVPGMAARTGSTTSTVSSSAAGNEAEGSSPTLDRSLLASGLPALPHEKGKGPMYPNAATAHSAMSHGTFFTASPALSTDSHYSNSSAGPRSSSLQPGSSGSQRSSPNPASPTPSAHLAPSASGHSHTSVLDRPRPRTPDPHGSGSSASTFASRGGSSYAAPPPSVSAALPGPQAAVSSTTSVLDRPRPKTPDASAALSPASTTPNISPTISRSTSPSTSTPPPVDPQAQQPPAKVSVLDRPRPRTPDAGAAFRFGGSTEGSRSSTPSAAGGGSRPKTPDAAGVFRFGTNGGGEGGPAGAGGSVLDRPRPKTPDSGAVFAFQVPPLAYGGPVVTEQTKEREEPSSVLSRPRPSATSVLNRPRPKTPDAQGWLDGAGGGSTIKAPLRFGAGAGVHRPTDSTGSTSLGSFSSHTKGSTSYDSLASRTQPSGLSSFTSATSSNTASPARPSFDSYARSRGSPSSSSLAPGSTSANSPAKPLFSSSTTYSSSAAPLLNLDFDFGGSPFGTSETMFGLSDLLSFGTSVASSPTTVAPISSLTPHHSNGEEDATTPTPTSERKDLGSALPPSANPPSADSTFSSSDPVTTSLGSSALAPSSSSGGNSYLTTSLVNPVSTSGRSTPRKEPPKVDLKLELELEMERAIPPNRSILADGRSSVEDDRAKRARRDVGEDELDSRGAGRRGPHVREHGSISSLGSVTGSGGGGTTGSISDVSVMSSAAGASILGGVGTAGSPKPQKRRRRRSLASLLSIGSANLLGKDKEKDPEKEESRRAKTPEPGMRSYTPEPGMRSYTPEPGMRAGTPGPEMSRSTNQQQQPPPQIIVPTASTFAPRLSLDKSLPPTPFAPSPAPHPSPPPSSSGHDQSTEGTSPVKRTGAALGRQLSRLRNRSNPSSTPSGQAGPRQPGFQVISGSTTRKSRNKKGSISSLGTSETHGSMRRDSYEFGAFPTAAAPPAPFASLVPSQPGPPPVAAPSAAAPSSVPFGRRVFERFTKAPGPSKPQQNETWSAPVKDHSAPSAAPSGPNGPTRHGRRRSSLSSLLGVNLGGSSASADGHDALSASTTSNGSKKILGMSLPAGRKSEDLLTSGRGRGPEREMRREWESPKPIQMPAQQQQQRPIGGRRSFDLLTDRQAIPRRPSTDDLLTLASAKLSKFAVDDEPSVSAASTVVPPPLSADQSTFESGGLSSHGSGHSTPSDEVEGKAAAVVARAALISRSDAGPAAAAVAPSDDDTPLYGTRTAAPVLVRSGSLRAGQNMSATAAITSPPAGPPSLSTVAGTSSAETADSTPKTAQSSSAFHQHKAADSGFSSDTILSTAWLQLEDTLALYNAATRENRPDRGTIINNTVLPFLKREEDDPAPRVHELLAQRQRAILFGWLTTLTMELREMQPAHRGTCLEAVAGIAESHFFSIASLSADPAGQMFYHSAVVQLLDFAVDKLNDKAVYANTLVFSGRIFALAFFRIEGVALKLLRALPPVKRQGLKRILDEANVQETNLPSATLDAFPPHLHDLCLRDFRVYTSLLLPLKKPSGEEDRFLVRDANVEVEMSGNWLIRWTASDSDLPFAFYRAYHRQLASQLVPFEARQSIAGQPHLPPSAIITAPGFLFVAASLLDKADALVHRNLRSVTSIGPNSGAFNTNDSANLSFGQKPKVLELAHRRVVATLLDVIGGPPSSDPATAAGDVEVRRHVFSGMLPVWIRACVKRTSMWDVRGVYLVLDLIEGLIYTLAYPPARPTEDDDSDAPAPRPDERFIDLLALPFIFDVLATIFKNADGTVTLLRALSFAYAHFEVFTLRPSDRKRLCEDILLDRALFERLLLFWNAGVRGYFIRLIVWRLARLGVVAQEQNPNLPLDEGIVSIFNLLNVRLEAVRKRHDALEPVDNLVDEEDYYFRPKRSTICSTRGVKEAPWTVDELGEPLDEEEDAIEEEDEQNPEEAQELVRSLPPPPSSIGSGVSGTSSKKGDSKAMAKVASWLKMGLGKKHGKNGAAGKGDQGIPDARIEPFNVERTATLRERRGREDSLTIYDDDLSAAETGSQELSSAPLPTTVETGIVPTGDSPGPHTPSASVADNPPKTPSPTKTTFLTPSQPFPSPSRRPGPSRTKSSRSEKRSSRSLSPAFFSFEFENGIVTRSDVDPSVAANASTTSVNTTATSDTQFPTSPIRPTRPGDPHSAISPRVSLRFSKRISILPPAALDLLKEAGPIEAVPAIPARFRQSEKQDQGYDKKLHPYAVRGLRDYEDALDEWTEWTARLWKEEEEAGGVIGKTFVDMVPRLAVNWPLQQGED